MNFLVLGLMKHISMHLKRIIKYLTRFDLVIFLSLFVMKPVFLRINPQSNQNSCKKTNSLFASRAIRGANGHGSSAKGG